MGDFQVWLTAAGRHKIRVIKVIRELTGLALAPAKEITDRLGLVREGLEWDDAVDWVQRLEAVGASAEALPRWEVSIFSYDRQQGADQQLLTVHRRGSTVGVRRHGFGRRGRLELHQRPTATDAEAFSEDLLAGRTAVRSEREAYAALTARNPLLEAAVANHPEEDAPKLVLADWLMEQGDVRGARLTRALCGNPTVDHDSVMLGPLVALLKDSTWERGLLRKAAMPDLVDVCDEDVEDLLGSLAAIDLRAFSFPFHLAVPVAKTPWPERLETIEIFRSHWAREQDEETVREAFLSVVSKSLHLSLHAIDPPERAALSSERLESLNIADGYGQEISAMLSDARLPNLSKLSVRLTSVFYPEQRRDLRFLNLYAPKLSELTLLGLEDLDALAESQLLRPVQTLTLILDDEDFDIGRLVSARPRFGDRRVCVERYALTPEEVQALREAGFRCEA